MSDECVRLYMLLPPEFPPSLRTMRDAQALGGIFEGPFQASGANLVVHAVCLASLLAFLAKNGVGHRHDDGGRNQQDSRPNGYRQHRFPIDTHGIAFNGAPLAVPPPGFFGGVPQSYPISSAPPRARPVRLHRPA